MFLRTVNCPRPLQKLEAVYPRLHPRYPHKEEIEKELAVRRKGYAGEKIVSRDLRILGPKYSIIQDVTLDFQGQDFQIDNIIFSQKAIYIVDAKNFEGKITFDTILNQFIHDNGKVEIGYRHPIVQLENQYQYLQNWLHERNFHNIPIHYYVAIAKPSTIIEVIGDKAKIAKSVAQSEIVMHKIHSIDAKLTDNKSPNITRPALQNAILTECRDFDFDILAKFGITAKHILPGVHCPFCGYTNTVWTKRSWHCSKCKKKSRHAHVKALNDYFLLSGETMITNAMAREFLQVKSRQTVTRMLKKQSGLVYLPGRGWMKKREQLKEAKFN